MSQTVSNRSRAEGGDAPQRADARASRARILAAATAQLAGGRRLSMREIAVAADVGRSTLYRHFPSRGDLLAALDQEPGAVEALDRAAVGPLDPVARSEAGDVPLTRVFDGLPANEIAGQVVAEARRLATVPVDLYVVDIDGSRLRRINGDGHGPEGALGAGLDGAPDELDLPVGIGPELPVEGVTALRASFAEHMPGSALEPLWLRGRAVGVLVTSGRPAESLAQLAREAAIAIELATGTTDEYAAARRRREMSAAAELQQSMLPPRVARVAGGEVAGSVLPSYDVGGDWLDYADNRDGAWLAVADAAGKGSQAAGLGAVVLGGFRAARREGLGLVDVAREVHRVAADLPVTHFFVTAVLARWHAPTATLRWLTLGHPPPLVVDRDGRVEALEGERGLPLGLFERDREFKVSERRLEPGDTVVLYSDGLSERRRQADRVAFGAEGLPDALSRAARESAATVVREVLRAAVAFDDGPLRDDATVLALAVR